MELASTRGECAGVGECTLVSSSISSSISSLLFGPGAMDCARTIISLLLICVGVVIATVNDFDVNLWGVIYALLGVVCASMYQIYIKVKQQDLGLDSYQLLYLQVGMLIVDCWLL